MPHANEGQLQAYLDGALAPDDPNYVEIKTHLAICADCRARLAQERAIRDDANAILARAVPRATPMPSFEELVARKAALQTVPPPRRGIPKVQLALAATLVLAMGAALLTTTMARLRVAREDAAMASSAAPIAAAPAAPAIPQNSPAASERVPAPAAQEPAVALRAPATGPQPSSAREQKARTADVASAEQARAGAGAVAAGASAAAPILPASPPARASAVESDEARRSVAENAAPAKTSAAMDAIALQRADVTTVRWERSAKPEAERRLGAPLFMVPGLALVSVDVSPASEQPAVRVRQALQSGGELELIERPNSVPAESKRVLATPADRARGEAPARAAAPVAPERAPSPPNTSPPAMSVRDVLVQRGPLLIHARSPFTADSLRALLDRTH